MRSHGLTGVDALAIGDRPPAGTWPVPEPDFDGEGAVTFTLPPRVLSIRELTEGRNIPVHGTKLTDNLPKLGVKVYEIAPD
jgi:hypothetical protein